MQGGSLQSVYAIIEEMADLNITVKVSYAKRMIELQMAVADSVAALKLRLEQETGVSVGRQRLFLKGTD